MLIELPWPPAELNPNNKAHWAVKSRRARMYRNMCLVLARSAAQAQNYRLAGLGKIGFFIEFCPPDRRRRDDDNMLASFKSGRDGVADALSVDDNRFVTSFEVGKPIEDGLVVVKVQELAK